MNLSLFKIINLFLKYYVASSSIIYTIHCLLFIIGINTWYVDLFIGLSLGGFIALFISSVLLGFCWLYRNLLIHLFLVSTCITYHMKIGFGTFLVPFLWVLAVYGLILIILIIKQKGKFFTNCNYKNSV